MLATMFPLFLAPRVGGDGTDYTAFQLACLLTCTKETETGTAVSVARADDAMGSISLWMMMRLAIGAGGNVMTSNPSRMFES